MFYYINNYEKKIKIINRQHEILYYEGNFV